MAKKSGTERKIKAGTEKVELEYSSEVECSGVEWSGVQCSEVERRGRQ